MKKEFGNVAARLQPLADDLPSQMPPTKSAARLVVTEPDAMAPASKPEPVRRATKPAPVAEELVQFTMQVRKSLRRQLVQLAADQDMTARAFVLAALRDKGLSITPDDLLDRRKA